mgnify:CR=1 FL=1
MIPAICYVPGWNRVYCCDNLDSAVVAIDCRADTVLARVTVLRDGRHVATMGIGKSGAKNAAILASQILALRGMADFNEVATDVYALSMDFDPRPGAASTLALASLDASGNWVNAVDLNDGGTKTFVKGPWKPQYGLGTYGFDARTGTVWAVLNYNGDFAVAGVR